MYDEDNDRNRCEILPELGSLNRASVARARGDEASAKFHEMAARENARRERLRLARYLSPKAERKAEK